MAERFRKAVTVARGTRLRVGNAAGGDNHRVAGELFAVCHNAGYRAAFRKHPLDARVETNGYARFANQTLHCAQDIAGFVGSGKKPCRRAPF